MQNVLVAGATGTTGNKIISQLKNSADYTPVAMVRKQQQVQDFQSQGVKTVLADLTEDVSHTCKGIDKVIFAAGSKGENLIEVDQEGAKKLADVAQASQVKKFVMLSSMGAANPAEQKEDMRPYMYAKHNADQHLQSTGLNYAIVRPGALSNEDGTGKIKLSESLDSSGKIPRDDVATTLVAALDDDVATNKVFEILNGDESIREAVQRV